MVLGAGAVTLVASLAAPSGTARAETGAGAGPMRSALNAEVTSGPTATLDVVVKGKEAYRQASVLGAEPTFVVHHGRLTSVTATARAGEPHLGLWVGVRKARARAKERLRGSLVFDRAGGENVTGSVTGRWNAQTRTFTGTWHGKQVTRAHGKKKTLVLRGTLSLLLPEGSAPPVTAS